MPKKAMADLTESMFYVLLALRQGPQCGTDAAEYVEKRTAGRVKLGPAILYTILGKFEKEGYILETQVEGRRRTYTITEKGHAAYREELERLRLCLADAAAAEEERGGTLYDRTEEEHALQLSSSALPVL